MQRIWGIGIVGAGVILEDHMRVYEHLADRVRVVGIADLDPMKLRQASTRFFIPFVHEDYRELLKRDDIDLIAVCTPPRSHEEIVTAALEAGKYVVCEKPLAHTLESADRIIRTCARFPRKLSTVYQLRFLPEVRRIIWLRERGLLGRLLLGSFTRCEHLIGTSSIKSGWWGRWDIAGGGAGMTQFIHDLDLMLYIFGAASEITAVMDTNLEGIESEDTLAATLRFESGALVSGCCTAAGQRHRRSIDIFGESAAVRFPWALECADAQRRTRILSEVMRAVPVPPEARRHSRPIRLFLGGMRKFKLIRRPRPRPSAHTPYIQAVLDAFESGEPPPTGPETARASLELCVAIYISALTGQTVCLPVDQANQYYKGISAADYAPRARACSQDEGSTGAGATRGAKNTSIQ